MAITNRQYDAVSPESSEIALLQELATRLASLESQSPRPCVRLQIGGDTQPQASIELSPRLADLLGRVATQLATGKEVTLTSTDSELTTQQTADLLNVSRPHLITLLKGGKIPFRLVGRHRRILARDALAYKQEVAAKRLQTLADLSKLDQELGLYD